MSKKANKSPIIFIVSLVVVVVIVAFAHKATKQQIAPTRNLIQASPSSGANSQLTIGTFVGLLPCADCSGIKVELTLTREQPAANKGTFQMSQTYLEKSVAPFKTQGTWTLLKGSKTDPNASVYQLIDSVDKSSEYYLKMSETQLKMLDQNRAEISSPFNYVLTKE